MCKGFKQISNDFFESDYWRQSRTYNDSEALLDIINQVRFEASEITSRIGGRDVTWGQAQWPASVRFLAARWHWTDWKVRSFLASLKRKGIISTSDDQGVNMITLHQFLVLGAHSHTETHTAIHTDNELKVSDLVQKLTQQITQQITQELGVSHSTHTNNNIGNNNDSSLRSESAHNNDACEDFSAWLSEHCPYIYANYKLLSNEELGKLKAKYSSTQIADMCERIENRKDLRKRYSNLYRTLLNWLKKERNETTSSIRNGVNSAAPTDEQLVSDTYDLINEARARQTVIDF